jgi:hypothetical protein
VTAVVAEIPGLLAPAEYADVAAAMGALREVALREVWSPAYHAVRDALAPAAEPEVLARMRRDGRWEEPFTTGGEPRENRLCMSWATLP